MAGQQSFSNRPAIIFSQFYVCMKEQGRSKMIKRKHVYNSFLPLFSLFLSFFSIIYSCKDALFFNTKTGGDTCLSANF